MKTTHFFNKSKNKKTEKTNQMLQEGGRVGCIGSQTHNVQLRFYDFRIPPILEHIPGDIALQAWKESAHWFRRYSTVKEVICPCQC